MFCDPPAERGADGGRHHGGDSVEGEGHAALLGRERVGQNRLSHGLEPAAAESLDDAEQNQQSQTWGDAAEQRADGEQQEAKQEKSFPSEDARQPPADGKNNGVRDQIRREHPGAFIVAGAQVARHVRQCDVGDAGVEHLHERRHRHHDGDQPGVEPRFPGRFDNGGCVRYIGHRLTRRRPWVRPTYRDATGDRRSGRGRD